VQQDPSILGLAEFGLKTIRSCWGIKPKIIDPAGQLAGPNA